MVLTVTCPLHKAPLTKHLPLSLTLFVPGILADDHDNAFSLYNSTRCASLLD
jgi:hypothetical protein